MSIEIIKERIKQYSPLSMQEEEHVIKEIYQEIALSGLSRSGFFKIAAFQGGTCLRIMYQLNRFSEDLDFILMHSNKLFSWQPYLNAMKDEFAIYGVNMEIKDARQENTTIQKGFLKDDSFAKLFELTYERDKSHRQKISIKFEIDTNPPGASVFELHQLNFPLPFSVVTQDKASLFASKCHALLCRKFLKGRDWYDFLWYVGNKITVNLDHLKTALIQTNDWPWQPDEPLNKTNLLSLLEKKIMTINWRRAGEDVEPLLRPIDREMLKAWTTDFFLSYVKKLGDYLKGPNHLAVLFRIAEGPAPTMDTRLFNGAVTEFDQDEIGRINESGTFWCQNVEAMASLEDNREYSVIFIHLDQPGQPKEMYAKTHLGEMAMTTYYPGETYRLPGWFIKNWNSRKLVHYHGIYRALYWFQPTDVLPQNTILAIQDYAKKKSN
ncbi:MAG: nucleotidyl transferase AbiEii/AbiGii toxin family protein [Chlamydiales bacterium]|nr:nucleotidyl transferase AbiEii/AbiGii toxin family protein [Chlamydiales bacterium]